VHTLSVKGPEKNRASDIAGVRSSWAGPGSLAPSPFWEYNTGSEKETLLWTVTGS
jgi:hypothetical protein